MLKQPKPKEKRAAPKSGKAHARDLRERRKEKSTPPVSNAADPRLVRKTTNTAPCSPGLLAPNNSYGPVFVLRGYYVDAEFTCIGCGKLELWTATQQKWWYEVAKGNVDSTANRCRACRGKERERVAEARRIQVKGMEKKAKRRASS